MGTILHRSAWSRARRQVLSSAAGAAAPRVGARPYVAEPLEDRRLMSTVAVFDNSAFVDTAGAYSSESDNVQKALQAAGHTVKTFTGYSSVGLRRAAGGAELLVIPELEVGDLDAAMTGSAKSALGSYVFGGGGLIVFSDFLARGQSLLNSVFGWSLGTGEEDASTRTGDASGTAFSSAPPSLDYNNATIATVGLPGGAKSVYETGGGEATVAEMYVGDGKVVILGYDFFDAEPVGVQDGGWLSVLNKAVAEVKSPDTDNNDEIGEAASLGINSTSSNSLEYLGDVDFYKFNGTAGQQVTITMNKDVNTLDSYLRVFDVDGNQVAGDDDSGGSNNAKVVFTPSATKTYYIGCSSYENEFYDPLTGQYKYTADGSIGPYKVSIAGVVPNTDPDDQVVEAKPLALGTASSTSIGNGLTGGQPAGQDVDMFKVTVVAGQKVGFDVDRSSGSTLDAYLRVFSYNAGTNTAAELKNNDNAAAPGEGVGKDPYIEYTFASAGTYYVAVSGMSNKTYGPVSGTNDVTGSTGAYSIVAKSLGIADPDDQISEAKLVSKTSTTTGQTINTSTDVDMYKFVVNAGDKIQIDVDRPSGSLNSYLRVFTSGGTQLASNNNAAAPGETANALDAYIQFTFSAAGTYYVAVSSSGNTTYNPTTGLNDVAGGTTGAYTLILKKV